LDDDPLNDHHVNEDNEHVLHSINDDVVDIPNMAMYNPFNDVRGLYMDSNLDDLRLYLS
jgi:hypothetical protein